MACNHMDVITMQLFPWIRGRGKKRAVPRRLRWHGFYSRQDVGVSYLMTFSFLPILMKAGRIYAAEIGEQLPPELKCRPLDVLDASDPLVLGTVISAIQKGTSRTVETVQKNGEATPGQ